MERLRKYIFMGGGVLAFWLSFSLSVYSQEHRGQEQIVYQLSLDEVSHIALQNNFDIQLAKFDTSITRTQEGVARSVYDTIFDAEIKYQNDQSKRTSTLVGAKTLINDYNIGLSKKLPIGTTVNVDMTNNRLWTNSSFVTLNPSHDSALKLTVEQDLGKNFFGIQDRGTVRLTQKDIEKSEYTSWDKIEETLVDVQEAYWELVLAVERLKIIEEMAEQAKQLHLLHQEKLKDGLLAVPEALAAEANYKTRRSEILVQENEVRIKENILKLHMNIEDKEVRITPSQSLALTQAFEEWGESLRKAFLSRRDYKKAKSDIEAKDIKLSMKKNNLWPEINLEASFARNGIGEHFKQAVQEISEEDNPELLATLTVTIPLENTKARAELKQAQLEKAKSLIEFKLLERRIMIGITDSVRTCNVFLEHARNDLDIVELQKQKLEEEEKRFLRGRSNTDTIIRYQEDLLNARWQAAQSLFDHHGAVIDLRRKEGILLDHYWEGEV